MNMTSLQKTCISAAVSACVLASLFVFKTIPSGNLWKGYRIVYASSECSSEYVRSVLAASGCKDVTDISSQKIPLPFAADTPEVSLASQSAGPDSYCEKRIAYFSDKGGRYSLYYVPEQYVRPAEKAVSALSQAGVQAGIDTQSGYPWMIPAVCIAFAVFLFVISVHKVVFLCGALFPVFFSYCMPFYPGASSVCLFLFALYLAQQVWGRKNAVSVLASNGAVLLFAAAAVLTAFLTSLRCGILFALAVAGTVSVLMMAAEIHEHHGRKYPFMPVMIRAAGAVPLFTRKTVRAAEVCASCIVLLIASCLLSADFTGGTAASRVLLPSASSGGITDKLPSIDDYIAWCWNVETGPYRSLEQKDASRHGKPKDGDSVVFPRYTEEKDGIAERDVTLVYNPEFRAKTVKQIDSLDYPAIEKIMKQQGKSFRAGYAFSTSGGGGILYVVLMCFSLSIPVLCSAGIIVKTRRWSVK